MAEKVVIGNAELWHGGLPRSAAVAARARLAAGADAKGQMVTPEEQLLRTIIRRAIEAEGLPVPAIWKGTLTELCFRVVGKLIGADAAIVSIAAGCITQKPTPSGEALIESLRDELQQAREALQRASGWLHAAYDRPPQTPECVSMLHEVDTARGYGA
jgi:hypothetical protein